MRFFCLVFVCIGVAAFAGVALVGEESVQTSGVGPQSLRPASTITAGSWTATGAANLYDATNDDSDSSYDTSATQDDDMELLLDAGSDPGVTNSHVVTIRNRVTGGSGGPERFTAWLYEGATLRATPFNAVVLVDGPGFTDHQYTLTGPEASSLTAYTNLRIRIRASTLGGGETLDCAEITLDLP